MLLTEEHWGSAVTEGKVYIARCEEPSVSVPTIDEILTECVLFDLGTAMSRTSSWDPWEWQRLHL